MTDPVKIAAGIDIAMSLIQSGMEVYNAVKNDDLTDEDMLELIDKQNKQQLSAKERLLSLYGGGTPL